MFLDVMDLRAFYQSPPGQAVKGALRAQLRRFWPSAKGQSVLALGYAAPLLRPLREEATALLVFMPAEQGATTWPPEGPNASCVVRGGALPLPDDSVDRALLLHALETAPDPDSLLREVWRVLKPEGRALFIVPNRRGLWAHSDRTPFGTGRPWSAFQLKDTLRDHGFPVTKTARALYGLPGASRPVLALNQALERAGPWLFPGFGGLLVMEASKQVYAPLLARSRPFAHRLVLPVPLPTARS